MCAKIKEEKTMNVEEKSRKEAKKKPENAGIADSFNFPSTLNGGICYFLTCILATELCR